MGAFRILLVVIFVVIAGYTLRVTVEHGMNLLPVFFGDIAAMGWPGQFNVDFSSFLVLSATWLAWRHRFSPAGFALGVAGLFGGGLFLSVYLFIASLDARGDWAVLLLGRARAEGRTPA